MPDAQFLLLFGTKCITRVNQCLSLNLMLPTVTGLSFYLAQVEVYLQKGDHFFLGQMEFLTCICCLTVIGTHMLKMTNNLLLHIISTKTGKD